MHLMVNALKSFASTELLANLYRASGQDDLMEESPAEEARRKETLEMCVAVSRGGVPLWWCSFWSWGGVH
jgi:hypothetical protein